MDPSPRVRQFLAILATVCFAVLFVIGVIKGFNKEDLGWLGLAFFAAAHI